MTITTARKNALTRWAHSTALAPETVGSGVNDPLHAGHDGHPRPESLAMTFPPRMIVT